MDVCEGDVFTIVPASFSPAAARFDGSVAELTLRPDGTISAQIRIPGPEVT